MNERERSDMQDRQYERTLSALADLTASVRDIFNGHTPKLAEDIKMYLDEVKCEVEDMVLVMEEPEPRVSAAATRARLAVATLFGEQR